MSVDSCEQIRVIRELHDFENDVEKKGIIMQSIITSNSNKQSNIKSIYISTMKPTISPIYNPIFISLPTDASKEEEKKNMDTNIELYG